jgi:hypothetical protein
MNEYAWSDGTKPERSSKNDNPALYKEEKVDNANNLALSSEWNIIQNTTNREKVLTKINERELVSQVVGNPFLNNSSYSEDIETQQNFLIPQNSNIEK